MTIALIIFAFFMASLVGWLVKQSLNTEPWVATGPGPELEPQDDRWRQTMRLGLTVLIAVITSLFGLFISAYLMRMEYADWRPMAEPALLWANTGILVLCSLALQGAFMAARAGREKALEIALAAGALLSLAFIAGQYVVWQQLHAAGYYLGGNPASAFFFVLTAVHALHLLGGLVALGRAGLRLVGSHDPAQVKLSVELCAVYWHFLLAVWVVLFALLSST